jgi:hypothetical protein
MRSSRPSPTRARVCSSPIPSALPSPSIKAPKLEEGMHPNTVGVMRGVLSAALNQVVYEDLIPANPCTRVKKAAARGKSRVRSCSRRKPRGS